MTRIGLISDTHGFLDQHVAQHFSTCDEIWHAGDFGNIEIAASLRTIKPVLKGVYGNIDGYDIRSEFPLSLSWQCEKVQVFMIHIGGFPGRYAPGVKQQLVEAGAKIFISGHSHILKIQYDAVLNCLHINPGAAGHQGWHKMRTLVRFTIDGTEIKDCEVIELGPRGRSV
jgi:uncharacterized protein